MTGLSRQVIGFLIAGSLGFAVDAGVVSLLVHGLGWNPYAARVVSFLCAVATTFVVNRHYSFSAAGRRPLKRQAAHYLVAMIGGFVVNYGLYALLVHHFAAVRDWPVLGVAAGSIAGMVVNFVSSRHWVFKARQAN